MSRNTKNNHYHYAEKYSGHHRRHLTARDFLHTPRKAAVFALVVLLVFGLVSTTFAAYVSETYDDIVVGEGETNIVEYNVDNLVTSIRTKQAEADDSDSEGVVYRSNGMDLAESGAVTTYYFRGAKNNWGATAFTNVSNMYSYYDLGALTTSGTEFKITTGNNNWTVPSNNIHWSAYSYTDVEGNSINLSDVSLTTGTASPGGSNGKLIPSSAQTKAYLLLFYTSSTFNSNSSQIQLAVSTSLPEINNDVYNLWGTVNNFENVDSGWGLLQTDIANNDYTVSLTAQYYCQMKVYKDDMVSFNGSTGFTHHDEYYGNNTAVTAPSDSATVTRTLSTSGNNLSVMAGTITGNHTFSFDSSSKELTIAYPTYTMSVTETHTGSYSATFAPTVAGSTSAVAYSGGYVQYKANTPTGYDFSGWRITSGSAKFSANGTSYNANATTIRNTSATVNVYPTSASATVTLQAVYKVKTFTVTYMDYDGSTVLETTNGVEYGTKLGSGTTHTYAPSTDPSHDGMTFTGWNKAVSTTVTAATTVTALYTVDDFAIEYIFSGTGVSGSGTQADRFEFPATSDDIYLDANVTPATSNTSIFNYTWSTNGTTFAAGTDDDEYSSQAGITQKSGGVNATEGDYQMTLYCKATTKSGSLSKTMSVVIYYRITNNYLTIRDFAINPLQKIFSSGVNGSASSAQFSFLLDHSGTSFDFDVFASNHNNDDFEKTGTYSVSNILTDPYNAVFNIATYVPQVAGDFTEFTDRGVKYLKVTATDTSRTDGNEKSYTSNVVTTAVGTTDFSAVRPFYFTSTDLDLSSYRVMAVYYDGSDVGYQTAQKVSATGTSITYRVNIPSDVTKLHFFAHVKNKYMIPEYINGSFTFHPDYVTYVTTEISPSTGENLFTKIAGTSEGITELSNGIYQVNGSLGAY